MKEFFVIKTGLPFYDEDIDMKFMHEGKERVAIMMMLVGAILVIVSLLGYIV